MQKTTFIIYSIVLLLIGSVIGGGVAYSSNTAARVVNGGTTVGVSLVDEKKLQIRVYPPHAVEACYASSGSTLAILVIK